VSVRGIDDLVRRVPELKKAELVTLSEIGALNSLGRVMHRKNLLCGKLNARPACRPLLDAIPGQRESSPLGQMTDEERLVADFQRVGHEHRPASDDVLPGSTIQAPSKTSVRFASGAGRAIHAGSRMRNRSAASGTAKGFVFLSLEDETGISKRDCES